MCALCAHPDFHGMQPVFYTTRAAPGQARRPAAGAVAIISAQRPDRRPANTTPAITGGKTGAEQRFRYPVHGLVSAQSNADRAGIKGATTVIWFAAEVINRLYAAPNPDEP